LNGLMNAINGSGGEGGAGGMEHLMSMLGGPPSPSAGGKQKRK
jgi:hypothetical protein